MKNCFTRRDTAYPRPAFRSRPALPLAANERTGSTPAICRRFEKPLPSPCPNPPKKTMYPSKNNGHVHGLSPSRTRSGPQPRKTISHHAPHSPLLDQRGHAVEQDGYNGLVEVRADGERLDVEAVLQCLRGLLLRGLYLCYGYRRGSLLGDEARL